MDPALTQTLIDTLTQLRQTMTHLDQTLVTIAEQFAKMNHDMGMLLTANICIASVSVLLSVTGIWLLSRQMQRGHQALIEALRRRD